MITVHTNYENIEAYKKITFGVNHSILLNTPTKLNIFIFFTILASYFHKQTVSKIYFFGFRFPLLDKTLCINQLSALN